MPKKETAKKAKALAHVIMQEMSFPVQPRASDKARLVGQLHDAVPTRDDISFQQQGGEATAKTLLSEDLIADEEEMFQLFFCIFHGEFAPSAGVDIDHVFSFNRIREKQIRLLDFLNTDREFADVFLRQPGVTDYFKRDVDGLVKGTSYFFKLCYNDIGNLLLMCHACNIKKNTEDPLEWFEKQETYFGKEFVELVRKRGEYQEGILLGKIYPHDGEKITLAISGGSVDLQMNESYGLGKLAREWFISNFRPILDSKKQFYKENYRQFNETLNIMRLLIIAKKSDEAHQIHKRLLKTLSALNAVYDACNQFREEQRLGLRSDSSGDDSADAAFRKKVTGQHTHIALEVIHELGKIKNLFGLYYTLVQAGALSKKCTDHHEVQPLSGQGWRDIFEILDRSILGAKTSGAMPSVKNIGKKITKLYDERSPNGILKQAEEAKQRAAMEIKLRESETRRAEVAERQAEELRARLAKYEPEGRQPGFFVEGHGEQRGAKRPSEQSDGNPDGAKKRPGRG